MNTNGANTNTPNNNAGPTANLMSGSSGSNTNTNTNMNTNGANTNTTNNNAGTTTNSSTTTTTTTTTINHGCTDGAQWDEVKLKCVKCPDTFRIAQDPATKSLKCFCDTPKKIVAVGNQQLCQLWFRFIWIVILVTYSYSPSFLYCSNLF